MLILGIETSCDETGVALYESDDNGLPSGEGLLAQILVDKYMDHLPLHRQLQRFARVGVYSCHVDPPLLR